MTALAEDGLPPLRAVIEAHGIAATKALGQNFLCDLNITRKIARHAGPFGNEVVVEIGPGPGGLTRALLSEGAARVAVVERDERCRPALEEIAARWPGKLAITMGDAMRITLDDLFADGETARIVANLPYNIGTELLLGWLTPEAWPPRWSSLTLMFQKEVAERIVAAPGTEHYGRLSVLAGWRSRAAILFDLPPQVFSPPPKVTSSVVQLVPILEPLPCALADLETVTRHAFGQRRKMLRQSLKPLGGAELAERAGLDPTLRAERVDVAGFVALANAIRPA